MRPPFTDLRIRTEDSGFYKGYNLPISVTSKLLISLLVVWALIWPGNAKTQLDSSNLTLLDVFNEFYIIATGAFAVFLFVIAAIPASGRRILGSADEPPEFANVSWFAMMFGAGVGVGLMVYSTAEPVLLWGSNPETVRGNVEPNSAEAVVPAFRYAYAHFGFHIWAIYVVVGLSLAYAAYTRNMPLTMRSALTPLMGRRANGLAGDLVDILGVVATILGVSVTIGFGVSQFVDGMYAITGMDWLVRLVDGAAPQPSTVGLLCALFLILGLSILSAVTGVGRGVKWLSNLNLALSLILLTCFLVFGSLVFAATTYGTALADYLWHFPAISFGAYETGTPLGDWQKGWTTFYWAWQVAFAPFVGLFLARISRGRSIREFVLGAVVAPAFMNFVWLVALGGTAINAELSGAAAGAISDASTTNMLFANLRVMLGDGTLLNTLTVMCVVLIVTFLVTSADSGILVINTIASGGSLQAGIRHRIIWGVLLTLVIGALLIAGNTGEADPRQALRDAMVIGALPFCMIMVLMCVALAKALIRDHLRGAGATAGQSSAA